jgi:hypothetical protein
MDKEFSGPVFEFIFKKSAELTESLTSQQFEKLSYESLAAKGCWRMNGA